MNRPARLSVVPPPSSGPSVNAEAALDLLADLLAERVALRLADHLPAPAETTTPGYLDVKGAASYLACPTSRIYDLVQLKHLVPQRDGRRLLFRPADLDAYLTR